MPSKSTDSLPFSIRSQGSTCTNTSANTLAADTDILHRLLANRGVTSQVIAGALEEYAWRGLLRGTRIREWCEGLRSLLDDLHMVHALQNALRSPVLITLFPFVSLITIPPPAGTGAQPHFFYPPPTLTPPQLASIDRDALIPALISLVEGHSLSEPDCFAPVAELILEYVGTVWRKMIGQGLRGSRVPDGIAKVLVELEFEMQCQGSRSALRTLVFPIIRRIRFDLGFVTSSQLISRLKSYAEHFVSSAHPSDPQSMITAWATRRLNTGSSPQLVHDELVFIREKLRGVGVEDNVEFAIRDLGLEKKDGGYQSGEGCESPIEESLTALPFNRGLTGTPPQLQSKTTNKKGFAFFSSKKASRKTTIAPTSPSSHRISNIERGPSTPFLGLPAGFNPDRRPSLPVISSSGYAHLSPSAHTPLAGAQKWSSLTSFHSTESVDSTVSQRSSNASQPRDETQDLLSQIMTFSEAADVRLILLDYVVEARYRLHPQGEGDWYFGNGRDTAAPTLDTLEGRLVGKRDVMDLGQVFKEIRIKFGIPIPGSPIRMASRARRRHPRGRSEASHAYTHTRSSSGSRDRSLIMSPGQAMAHGGITESRGVSFELDSYYHRHIPEEDELDHHLDSISDIGVSGDDNGDASGIRGGDSDADPDADVRTEESSSNETVKDGRRQSTGAASLFSLSSALSTSAPFPGRSGNGRIDPRASAFSSYAFSIREAKVEYPHEAVAVGQGRLQGGAWEEVLDHAPLPLPPRSPGFNTLFPSRSESSLLEPTFTRLTGDPSAPLQVRRDHAQQLSQGVNIRINPIPGHLGVPRPPSRADSFHSLLSALNLETHVPFDYHHAFQDPMLSPPLTPQGPASIQPPAQIPSSTQPANLAPQLHAYPTILGVDSDSTTQSRRRQNRQYVVFDHPDQDQFTPDGEVGGSARALHDLPEEAATPMLGPSSRRQRHMSTRSAISIPASISTLDSFDHLIDSGSGGGGGYSNQRADLPLAQLLALFVERSGPGGVAGTRAGTRPEDVHRAVRGFVQGEMRYADELGSGWDGEDQRRVIWLLRQVAALVADPALQYPIHQQILHLIRNPAPSARSSLISNTSLSTTGSSGTEGEGDLATPLTLSRSTLGTILTPTAETPGSTAGPATPILDEREAGAQALIHLASKGSRESVGTFGPGRKSTFGFKTAGRKARDAVQRG